MSSVAKRFTFLAIGTVSVAAVFAWYLSSQKKKKEIEDSKSDKKTTLNSTAQTANQSVQNGNMRATKGNKEEKKVDEQMEENNEKTQVNTLEEEGHITKHSVEPVNTVPSDPAHRDNLENLAHQQIVKPQTQAQLVSCGSDSSGERSASEGDYDCEEDIEEGKEEVNKDNINNQECVSKSGGDGPLASLFLGQDNAPFSWSEEVERSYRESLENADTMDGTNEGYEHSESPGAHSQNSEVSSQDSGRATGGLASSLSPMDEGPEGILPQYEFEIPNTLVGLIIGVKGKTIKELSIRTEVKMLIRPHHTPAKVDTHQICQVRGKRDLINKCLCMLRRRFPPARFPDLNLQPVLPPPLPNNLFDALHAQPTWLTLPEVVPTEVVVSSLVDPGHIFIQQPTHPSFSSLNVLDRYMLHLYSQQSGIPALPKPCETGLLCAAPVLGAWFRAVTVLYYADNDEVLVRFVDYGGYTRLARGDLRQIRTDLMTLPFQAIECYLAHVQPVDGTWQWGDKATDFFKKLCMGKVIEAHVIGYHVDDRVPFVELSAPDEEGKIVRVDRMLLEAGLAKASDPSKVVKIGGAGALGSKKNSTATLTAMMTASV